MSRGRHSCRWRKTIVRVMRGWTDSLDVHVRGDFMTVDGFVQHEWECGVRAREGIEDGNPDGIGQGLQRK